MDGKKKVLKRGYYFPPDLLEAWQRFHLPSKDYSPSAASAFAVWMTLGADKREKIRKIVYTKDIDAACKLIKKIVL